MEEWKPCPGFAGYTVSSRGRVKSPAGREMCLQKATKYPSVTLRSPQGVKHAVVARLVCEAFNGPPPSDASEVGHRDQNNTNNAATNLFWTAHTELTKTKLTRAQASEIRTRSQKERGVDLAKEFSVTPTTISLIKNGLTWRD